MPNQLDFASDPLGIALRDYWNGKPDALITVHSSITEEEEYIPAAYLFRDATTLPDLEKIALEKCRGKVLDAGAGAGSHALLLQERGLPVTALDLSLGAVALMRERGVADARLLDLFAFREGGYDTLLLLMNGIGLAGTLAGLDQLLEHAKTLLAPGGQVLCDSTDILYMFQEEDGSVWIDLNGDYYGEVTYQMEYDGVMGAPFAWLFVAPEILSDHAEAHGYACEIVASDDNDQYLARLTLKK
jgi:SAM-dependent methyltransferase